MLNLIARLETATDASRELDLAIYVALWPVSDLADVTKSRRGLDGQEGMSWDIRSGAVVFERWDDRGNCPFNGGYQLLTYTSSIDAALTLVPEGWEWQVSNRAPKPHAGRAYLHNRELIFTGWGTARNPKQRSAEVTAITPALALCIAALKARYALASNVRATPEKQEGK